MMKWIVIPAAAVAVFCATLIGMMAVTGNLTKERLQSVILGPNMAQPGPARATDENLGAIARQQSAREDDLNRRAEELKRQEERVALAKQEMTDLQERVSDMLEEFTQSLDTVDEKRQAQLQEIATSLGKMEAESAAEALQNMDEDIAVEVLSLITGTQRGEILTAMEPKLAARLLTRFQEPRY